MRYKRNSLEEFHDQINARMQMESNVRADDQEGEPPQENLRKLGKNIEEVKYLWIVFSYKKLKLPEVTNFRINFSKTLTEPSSTLGPLGRSP